MSPRLVACCPLTRLAVTFRGTVPPAIASNRCKWFWAPGEVVELSQHVWAADQEPPSRVGELASRVGVLLQRHSALLLRPPWSDIARGCGYRVEKVLDGDRVDLARLMCGAEGTLGIITEATLRLDRIPEVRGVVLLFFERLDGAAKAALDLAGEDIAACDLMDRRLLEIVRDGEAEYAALLPARRRSHVAGEVQGAEPVVVRQRLNQLCSDCRGVDGLSSLSLDHRS